MNRVRPLPPATGARAEWTMQDKTARRRAAPRFRLPWTAGATLLASTLAPAAHASLFSGDTLDAVANGAAWVVLFIAPLAAIGIFLIIHILPEKIAEKKQHPQLDAIKTLCLLSLVFGGMLWPLAWLWAYTRPVIHKMAYGTDKVPHAGADDALHPLEDAKTETVSREA
jgi:CBS domain containing-hemolysin-like protein